jgi:alpha-amylase
VPEPISWADVDRDLTAWLGNDFQVDTLQKIYELVPLMHASTDKELVTNWRKLQSSDHYYYMCTKWAADGDVHAYFSPYQSPHEAYRRFCIALSDLKGRLTTS